MRLTDINHSTDKKLHVLPNQTQRTSDPYLPVLQYKFFSPLYNIVLFLSGLGFRFKKKITLLPNLHISGGTVLDVGCGTGTQTQILSDVFPSAHIVGIDPDDRLIRISKQNNRAPSVSYVEGSATNLPFKSESCSVVFSTLTFHHLTPQEKKQAFSEILRVLKPGGYCILTDWGILKFPLLKYYFYRIESPQCIASHFEGFVPQIAAQEGFMVISETLVKPSGIYQWKLRKKSNV